MSPRWNRLIAIVLLATPAVAQPPGEPATSTDLRVPERTIPVPTTLSPQLTEQIRSERAMAGATPATPEEWRETVKAVDESAAQFARATCRQLGATVTAVNIAGVTCYRIVPAEVAAEHAGRLLVHVHGGAYVFFGGEACTREGALIAHAAKTEVISVDCRMPPDAPFPAPVDDAVAVWTELARSHDPSRTALFGSSAGGGLAMATTLKLRDLGVALPGALFLGTPWSDLTKTGDTFFTLEGIDGTLGRYDGFLGACAELYGAGRDLRQPLLSPVYADLTGFPPTILISGTRDLFLSLTVRTHRALRQAGVDAQLHVFEGQSHGQYLACYPAPESLDALGEVARFFDARLAR